MDVSRSFTILGSGVAGLTVAAEMTRRGTAVKMIDPAGAPGTHACSWWAGGMLAPECESVVAERSIVSHGRGAADWWAAHGAEVVRNGTLVVALDRDQSELTTFARRVRDARWLDAEGIAELEPILSDRFGRAVFIPDEAHINPRASIAMLHRSLQAMDVPFVVNGDADGEIIDCRGLAAADTLSDLRGVKGEVVMVRSADIEFSRPVRMLHPRFPLYIVPRGDGVFFLGATQIESNQRGPPSVRSVMELLNAAFALHPAFGEAEILEIGADARPAFPDNLPRIRHDRDRIYVNGLFRHGFLLGPALARMTADLLLHGSRPEDWYEDRRER